MVKKILLIAIILGSVDASENFEEACIKCHKAKDIPSEILYRRYLIKYSSKEKIKSAMTKYLKNPSLKKTIMPQRYISKFGLKKASKLSDTQLSRHIDTLIEKYKIKNKMHLLVN